MARLPEPILQPVHGTDEMMLRADYTVVSGLWQFTVFSGFRTDGQSVPRLLWGFAGNPWDEDVLGAAIIHDALYASEQMTREMCDQWFWRLMLQNKISRIKAWLWHTMVRRGGKWVWKKHTRDSVETARLFVNVCREGKLWIPAPFEESHADE